MWVGPTAWGDGGGRFALGALGESDFHPDRPSHRNPTKPVTPLRITLELDRDLLEEARSVLGVRTFTEAIERALREAVERARVREGWAELLGSDLSWASVDELEEYRRRFSGPPPRCAGVEPAPPPPRLPAGLN